MIVELKENVYWVGAIDWDVRTFHGHEYSTHRGTSYNAYLIKDEKTVLVDTVAETFRGELLSNISGLSDISELDYVVANHAEADHSGSLPEIMKHAPNATLIVSKRGEESIQGHYHQDWRMKKVVTGDRISIGENELLFIEAPMLHWPDSMFTYLTNQKILMPNDAFGQHYAAPFRFNDQVDQTELFYEALKYYVNILTPFSRQVIKKIEEFTALNLPVDIIAPSHGIIWRDDPLQIVKKYREWAEQKPEPRAVIIYDTMWNATRRMAEAIGEGLASVGVDYKMMHAATTDRNDLLVDVFKARAIIIGSPTFNNGLLPTITPVLEDIQGLKFQNKIGVAFGSYGWGGGSIEKIEALFNACKIPLVHESFKCKWQPGKDDLETGRSIGIKTGEEILRGMSDKE